MFDGISLRVDPRRLNLGTDKAQDERLAVMERVALTAVVELPHTAISGAGLRSQPTLSALIR